MALDSVRTKSEAHADVAAASPVFRPTKEVRLAVVMYGGSSLAIYMNGVAQELLHLVRATAPSEEDPRALTAHEKLSGTEKVYRRLGRLPDDGDEAAPAEGVSTRFVVDIISGTSAGGINGIFLAKALANDQQIDALKNLWIDEGDIGQLLNDGESNRGLAGVEVKKPPKSLLNGQRMYYKLLEAFDGMDGDKRRREEDKKVSRLVDQLDLYVTTTDLSGLVLPIKLTDKVIDEPRYRNVYHFLYAPDGIAGEYRSDFGSEFNPFLAFAARCTSSLPFVFEPMRLLDIDPVIVRSQNFRNDPKALSDSDRWDRFIRDYLPAEGDASSARKAFAERAFGDGGALDNAPFSYATDALSHRRADVPVERKLLYVEPDPKSYDPIARGTTPDAVTNLLKQVVVLPRTETIRQDLDRVIARNRSIGRLDRVLRSIDDDVEAAKAEVAALRNEVRARGETTPTSASFDPFAYLDRATIRGMYLEELISTYGVSYGAYQRLRVAELTDDLSRLFVRLAGLNEDSDDFIGMRYFVRAWHERHYWHFRSEAEGRDSYSAYLLDLDARYTIRKLDYLLGCVDELDADHRVGVDRDLVNESLAELRAKVLMLRCRDAAINPLFRALGETKLSDSITAKLVAWARESPEATDHAREFALSVGERATLRQAMSEILLTQPDEAPPGQKTVRAALADSVAGALSTELDAVGQSLIEALRPTLDGIEESLAGRFLTNRDAASSSPAKLGTCFERFAARDMLSFPITYGTGGEETSKVDVYRISPKDATALVDVATALEGKPREKVAGARYGHFGAFFDRLWRENDIMWGRLDGAERLIEALVPRGEGYEEHVKELRLQAFKAILAEELTEADKETIAGVWASAYAQLPPDGRTEAGLLAYVTERLGIPVDDTLEAFLAALIELPTSFVDYYERKWTLPTHLDPKPTLRNAARATHVTGEVFKGISDRPGLSLLAKPMGWVSLFGRLLAGAIEVALPGRLAHQVYRHWVSLLLVFAAVLIVGGIFLPGDGATSFGWQLLLLTIGVVVFVKLVGGVLQEVSWRGVALTFAALAVAAAIGAVWLESRHFAEDFVVFRGATLSHRLWLEARIGANATALLLSGIVAAVVGAILMSRLGRRLVTGSAPKGIVNLELAGSRDATMQILREWSTDGVKSARSSVVWDYAFIVVYGFAFYVAMTWATIQWRGESPVGAWIGFVLAYGVIVAASLDAFVENPLLLSMLEPGDPGVRRPRIARRAAITKFFVLEVAVAYFAITVIGWAFWLRS